MNDTGTQTAEQASSGVALPCLAWLGPSLALMDAAWLAAWAAVATALIYVALGVFAFRQVSEAKALRREQSRPYVIVDFAFRSVLVSIEVKNIGSTPARNVVIAFDKPLATTLEGPAEIHDSPLFRSPIPMLAPGRSIQVLFDSAITRLGHPELPLSYEVTCTYSDMHGRNYKDPPAVLDLGMYVGSSLSPKDMPDSTLTSRPSLLARVKQASSRSRSSARFGSPVRSSCRAAWLSRASASHHVGDVTGHPEDLQDASVGCDLEWGDPSVQPVPASVRVPGAIAQLQDLPRRQVGRSGIDSEHPRLVIGVDEFPESFRAHLLEPGSAQAQQVLGRRRVQDRAGCQFGHESEAWLPGPRRGRRPTVPQPPEPG